MIDTQTGEPVEGLEPTQVVQHLNSLASGLEKLGNELAQIRADLEPVQKVHDEHVENFIAGLWDKHVKGEVKKWPGEDVRLALARREMDTATRGKFTTLKDRERRCIDAIGRTKEAIGAYRSILSAQREGLI